MRKNQKLRGIIFIISFFILAVFTVISVIQKHNFVPDNVLGFLLIGLVYLVQKRSRVSDLSIILVNLSLLMHTSGTLGLYGKFVVSIIGFDKLVHIFAGFAVTIFSFQVISEERRLFFIPFAILVVLGLGAVIEINEYIGTRYFGINNGGMFAIGDELPEMKSDLQKYDTYWDMMFNLFGSVLSGICLTAYYRIKQNPKSS